MKPTTATQYHPEVAQQLRLLRLSGVTDSESNRVLRRLHFLRE